MILTGTNRIHGIGSTKDLSGAPPSLEDGEGTGSGNDPEASTRPLYSLGHHLRCHIAKRSMRTNRNRVSAMSFQGTPQVRKHLDPRKRPRLTSSDSPVELLTNEYGTYEEVKEGFRAAAKEMAMARRQQQTLDQLASMQLCEPGIIRLRQPLSDAVAELDTEPPRPAELAGSSCKDGFIALAARRSTSSQLFGLLGEGSATTTPYEEQSKSGDRRFSVLDMPWAHDDPVACNKDQISTAKDPRRKTYVYQPHSDFNEPQSGGEKNRHSTSMLADTDEPVGTQSSTQNSSALASPAVTPLRTSITDTTEEHASYSCFGEFDRLVKELPPRTSRRRLHPEAGSAR
ncbi:MAG: hypothetical protein Q9208_000068 [Pyrenodesmia sp. 3 TL-2023]